MPLWVPPSVSNLQGLGTNVATFLSTPSSANLAAALTDETGSGAAVFGTSPSLTTPVITGVSDGSSASSGIIGEVLRQTRLRSAATSLSTGTAANVTATALTLTAGDWDITAQVTFIPNGTTTTIQSIIAAISLTSATLPGTDTTAVPTSGECYVPGSMTVNIGLATSGVPPTIGIPKYRVSLSGTTTFYLIARAVFAVSTLTAAGSIEARRAR